MTASLGLVHSAVFYGSQGECLDAVLPFLVDWLDRADPVLVAVPADTLVWLRDALGAALGGLVLADMAEVGRNPGRILGLMVGFGQQHPGHPVRIISEAVWPGRTAVEYPACVHHEALVNVALAGQNVTNLCLYDASQLDDAVLADAGVTHPVICRAGSSAASPTHSVDLALERCNQPLSTGPLAVTYTVGRLADLAGARKSGTRYGRLLGLSDEQLTAVRLIITELATNSLRHGGGACVLAFWHDDGYLVCEVRDTGRFDDLLGGRRPPRLDGCGASGLYVVNAVADLVRIYTSPAGTTIHAYLRLGR